MWKCSSEEFWGWMDYLIFNIKMSWEIPVYIEVIWNKRGDKLWLKDSLYVLMQQFLGQYRSIPLFPAHVYSNISLCSGSGLEVICIATLSQIFFLKTSTGEGGELWTSKDTLSLHSWSGNLLGLPLNGSIATNKMPWTLVLSNRIRLCKFLFLYD